MKIILKKRIQGLGYKNDMVDVKPGYGRNYLIPQGLAIIASPTNVKMIAENVKQAAHKAEQLRQAAKKLAESIGEMALDIKTKAGESGKIFGSITALQVSDALAVQGFNVDRKNISFETAIKQVGEYKVELDLHKEVKHQLAIRVVAE